jgi:hypothetical protein
MAQRALGQAFGIYETTSCSLAVLQSQYSISKWLMRPASYRNPAIARE